MTNDALVPVKFSLLAGDYCTLWAPIWREHGAEWQAFLGDDSGVFAFASPADLLAFLDSEQPHDLTRHPRWGHFASLDDARVVPDDSHDFDLVGVPALLAERPSYENVKKLARTLGFARSLAAVTSAEDAMVFFASHSILRNVDRGFDHYAGDAGLSEWSGVGRVVLANWLKVLVSLGSGVIPTEVAASASEAAAERITLAQTAREEAKAQQQKEEAAADPYDSTMWAAAGIDPIKISIEGRTLYSMRTYLDGSPVFLGKFGEIYTFPSAKTMLRWIVSHEEHDLARVATWEDVLTAANAGELEVSVHPDNAYTFTGLVADIDKGIQAVDTEQMARCYELMADAADWARDDSLNSFFLANPRMQDYISYMLGSSPVPGYTPSAPFSDHADAWQEMENMLLKRFSRG